MGILSLQEDRPTPRAVYNWRVYYCATVAAFCAGRTANSSFIIRKIELMTNKLNQL